MPQGEGKGWSKGETAATDARVARNAAGHVGRTYQRHLTPGQDRRYRGHGARTLPLEWSDAMGYVVGLMATDGCLINTGRHLSFDSGDEQLVQTFLRCLGRSLKYRAMPTKIGGVRYRAQFGDVRFYSWLQSIGLSQRKSLTIGAIDVPDRFLYSLLRGLLEGDGHISNFVHRPTRRAYPDYEYERFGVFFSSASRPHLEWIRERVKHALGVEGSIQMPERRPGRHDFFKLQYGKHASIALMQQLYGDPDAPRLERKWRIWDDYRKRELGADGGSRTLMCLRTHGSEPCSCTSSDTSA